MNINFNPQIFTPNISSTKSIIQTNLAKDSVHFSGNIPPKSQNEKEAEEFGLNIYALMQNGNLTHKNIQKEGRKNIPFLYVDKLSNLSRILGTDTSHYNAYTLPEYSENCKLKKLTLFAPDTIKEAKDIGSVAHEYTHCLQRYKSGSYLGLEKYTGGDLLQTRVLNNLSAIVFSNLEQGFKTSAAIKKESELVESGMNEEDAFFNAYGCKDESEYKRLCKKAFNSTYDSVLDNMANNPDIKKHLPLLNNPLQLKRIVREQCQLRAEMEMEAYTVQKNVVQGIDKNLVTPENEFNPILYKKLSELLYWTL